MQNKKRGKKKSYMPAEKKTQKDEMENITALSNRKLTESSQNTEQNVNMSKAVFSSGKTGRYYGHQQQSRRFV